MNQEEFVARMKERGIIPASYPPKDTKPKLPFTQDTVDLVNILLAQGMQQKDIAEGMYLDQSTVSRIKLGKRFKNDR